MREMKDSGIQGVDLIPVDWHRIQLEHCANIIRGGSPRPIEHYMSNTDDGYAWIKIGDTVKGSKYITKVKNKIIPSGLTKTRYVKSGTLLLTNSMSFGEPYILSVNGCIHDGWLAFSNLRYINKEFLYYFLASSACRVQFDKFSDGGVVQNLNIDKVKHSIIFFPDKKEQKEIVRVLDEKCAEIDVLSADVQAEIETLEAYKQSVIAEAVTKGLDKNVAMKDSGMAWLPKLPTHWEIIPSKFLFKNMDARKRSGDEQLTASQKYGIITQADYMERVNAKVVLATQKLDDWKHVEPNDFVISLRSFQGGLEMSETSGCITWHYVVLRATHKIYPRFYKWLFKSSQYINALQGTCNFIRDGQDLRYSNFAQVPLYIPPLDEQKKIACFLDDKCAEIDNITAYKQEQLTVLADYKKSLIYEYVTGKKEVPEI